MAGGGGFMARVMSYVVNEFVVKGLAESPTFQRFAVRTSKTIEDMSAKAIQKRQKIADQIKEISENLESNKFR